MLASLFAGNLTESERTALCLIGPSCFSLSADFLAQYESNLIGVQWDNINETYENFKFNTCLTMLFVDTLIYVLLTLYFDRVWPSRFGQRLHPLFFVNKSFWCPNKDKEDSKSPLAAGLLRQGSKYEEVNAERYNGEEPLIKVRGLKKHFGATFQKCSSGHVVKAVDGVSLDMYKGEVFCLLGHNGAGKTTTIGMLTGLLTVTEGGALIDGHSVTTEMSEIRRSLGVCPQHDVLFRRLTSEEHLALFARLKGVPEEHIKNEVQRTLIQVGIMEKKNSYPHQMSGGQRRKLSLGIALIGGSKIVFLDEPTSGMDPQSRRITWNMIAKEKKNRCIILTTHFMDEADILGDRVAVMADGQVKCCGSPLFLKRQYGVGYTFTVSLDIDVDDAGKTKEQIDEIVLNTVPRSETVASAGAEICYRLPFEETQAFPEIFDALDAKKEEFKIKTYGISITTLEEVFLKIGQLEAGHHNVSTAELKVEEKNDDAKLESQFPQPTFQLEDQSEFLIFFRHVGAILYQRLALSIRDIRSLTCQILLPAVFTLLGLWILELVTQPANNPSLLMTVDQWYDAEDYNMPFSQATNTLTSNDVNYNTFSSMYDAMIDVWDSDMVSFAGNAQEYEFVDAQYNYSSPNPVWNGTAQIPPNEVKISNFNPSFADKLVEENNPSDKILHYNAFYVPSTVGFQNPDGDDYISYPSRSEIHAVVNVSAYHALPITYNALHNWILKYRFRNVTTVNPSIQLYSWPFPTTSTEAQFDGQIGGFFVALFFMIALAFLPIGAVYNIVRDRTNLTKHQQLVSGVSCAAYWTANYIADIIISLPTLLFMWILVHIFDAGTFLGEQQGAFVLTLLLFTLSVTPFTYLLSFTFSSADKAQVMVGTAYIIFGLLLLMASFIIDALPEEDLSDANKELLDDIYRIFPTFLMADSLMTLVFRSFGINGDKDATDWDVAGKDLTYMAIEMAGYFVLVILVEYALLYKTVISKAWNKNKDTVRQYVDAMTFADADSDVQAEIKRIQAIDMSGNDKTDGDDDTATQVQDTESDEDDKVIISGLHKLYMPGMCCGSSAKEPIHAVRGVHLGVKRGEVFGYLGVNGAGKTTTLACLTGERAITYGDAYINGISISNQTKVRRFVGYCPQFDALFPLLTGREHLSFYGRVKGLSGEELQTQIEMLLNVLSLTKYANRRAGTYSGGNKRKLSVAIAMIGNPPIVFLDEPSTGMDPMARRSMWEFIRETMNGRCVILTTHSMEESEALCHRFCIMTAGQLRCLGTPQQLKTKFGKGYQLDLTLESRQGDDDDEKSIQADKSEVERQLSSLFNLTLVEHAQTKLVYEVTLRNDLEQEANSKMSLGSIFRALEEFKKKLPISSYALNQTTLEQIFIKMAKQE